MFSIMNNTTWTDERNRMTVPTLRALLVARADFVKLASSFKKSAAGMSGEPNYQAGVEFLEMYEHRG
jgi:hypothetical protein